MATKRTERKPADDPDTETLDRRARIDAELRSKGLRFPHLSNEERTFWMAHYGVTGD